MAQTVVLRHTTPDGMSHFDWMIEDLSIESERRLRTWRLDRLPGQSGAFDGEQIGDHRAAYLTFEGDIGKERGAVRREFLGVIRAIRLTNDRVDVAVMWENGGLVQYLGARVEPDGTAWRFRAEIG